jgi:myo-inositol-1-phosphate synthase
MAFVTCQKQVRISQKSPHVGLLVAGIGGNNGSTLAATILLEQACARGHIDRSETTDLFGSVTQKGSALTIDGTSHTMPSICGTFLNSPADLVVGGWDVRTRLTTLEAAVENADVLPYHTRTLLKKHCATEYTSTEFIKAGVSFGNFTFVDDTLRPTTLEKSADKMLALESLVKDIDRFAADNNLRRVVVLYSGNTECNIDVLPGINDTAINYMLNLERGDPGNLVSPAQLYCLAAIQSKTHCTFINSAAQLTCGIPGLRALAIHAGRLIIGEDLKTGQTCAKGALSEYLLGRGMPIVSISSNNALGNHDGFSLQHKTQNQSKITSKSSMTGNFQSGCPGLYDCEQKNGRVPKIAHAVSITFLPGSHGDTKRATDEYTARITHGKSYSHFMVSLCEDTLLALGVLIDLVLMTDALDRALVDDIHVLTISQATSLLGFFVKSPTTEIPTTSFFSHELARLTGFCMHCAGVTPMNLGFLECLALPPSPPPAQPP